MPGQSGTGAAPAAARSPQGSACGHPAAAAGFQKVPQGDEGGLGASSRFFRRVSGGCELPAGSSEGRTGAGGFQKAPQVGEWWLEASRKFLGQVSRARCLREVSGLGSRHPVALAGPSQCFFPWFLGTSVSPVFWGQVPAPRPYTGRRVLGTPCPGRGSC